MKKKRNDTTPSGGDSNEQGLFELTEDMLESAVGGASAGTTPIVPGRVRLPGPLSVHDWDGNPLHI
ncbi:MAG: hypothetical protein ACRBN8_01965 [Nannocystales bacterium]